MAAKSEAERAKAFARFYVALVEALLREGCPEDIAREEARMTAFSQLQTDDDEDLALTYDPALGPCPTCGRG